MQFLGICAVRQNLYVFGIYLSPDPDDRIYHCLRTSMAAVQVEDVHAIFLFFKDLIGHHQGMVLFYDH